MFGNLAAFFSSGENIAFMICALLAISGSIYMISFTKVIHMVLAVGVTFISLAGLYVLLGAEFVAVTQVLIYGGGVSILMIFGIMMTKHRGEEVEPKRPAHNLLLGVGILGLLGIILYAIQQTELPGGAMQPARDNTLEIGKQLFTQHVIPFELMSVLLTVAFIGAIIIAKREED